MNRSRVFRPIRAALRGCVAVSVCVVLSTAWNPASAGDDLREVLRQLALKHDFRLWVAPGLPPAEVDEDIDSLPLEQALERLLRDYSHVEVTGDRGRIVAIYVLPPGEDPPASRVLQDQDSARVLADALANEALPDGMKSALLDQALSNNEATRQSIRAQRGAVIDRLIELVGRDTSASSASKQLLLENLEAARDAPSK